ncbi:MAG: hypothetical protein KDK39_19160, partial [Leptospiraceae bacterium]|nr:hypothetical protein [Leptospiraceae bacterium]
LDFQNLLKQHFELEEEVGFKHSMFIGNQEKLKSVQEFKTEHHQMLAQISDIVDTQRNISAHDELRRNLLKQKVDQLVRQIANHEHNEARIISETIQEFKNAGRFTTEPTFTETQIEGFEKDLNFIFPDTWKTVVTNGSYDQSTFYFEEPHAHAAHPDYVIFATWNDIGFGFCKADPKRQPHFYPVYVLSDDMQPERKYDDFNTWFQLVFEIANQPINAG